jgi:AraC family transcriptional activator of pobA
MSISYPVLNIEESEINVPFEIHTMKWIDQNRHQQNSTPHKHNYFVIIWVLNGSGQHLIDLDKHEITNHTAYCISPGQVHLLKANEDTEGYVISFTSEFLCLNEANFDLIFNTGLFYNFTHSPIISVTPDMAEEMEAVVQKIEKEFKNYYLLRSEIIREYLKIFMIYLTRQFKKTSDNEHHSRNVELVQNFIASLEKNFASKKMVSDYAAELSVTPNYLNEIVKKVSGFSVSDHIKRRVVLEAKRHILYLDVSMKEIAYSLGFDDLAHFSKYFKSATGMNFSDFKKTSALL